MNKQFRMIGSIGMLLLILAAGCGSDDINTDVSAGDSQECQVFYSYEAVESIFTFCSDNPNDTVVVLNRIQDEFIWQGLNLYYYWQQDVPDLLDSRFESYDSLHTFLNEFESSETLFESLQSEEDRFSWMVEDYQQLDASFQGITKSFGFEYRLLTPSEEDNSVVGFVEYVIPNSPAHDGGLERGDIFNNIDGINLNLDNYESLLGAESYTLSLVDYIEGAFVPSEVEIAMTAIELTENPILLSSVFDTLGTKAGYLVYNQFINNDAAHLELNEVFGEFKNEGITELVLDLRYNPGGSLTTARILASLIHGAASSSTNFGSIIYNDKLTDFDTDFSFVSEMELEGGSTVRLNRLFLNSNRVFILTGKSTASASELLIAGLEPFMEVILIGENTVGKNVGSITLYDSPESGFLSNDPEELNEAHTYAMQPIVSQLANSDGFTDYSGGFVPDVYLDELDFYFDLKPLGEIDEPFLNEVFAILTGAARQSRARERFDGNLIFDSRYNKKYIQTIRLDIKELNQLLESY